MAGIHMQKNKITLVLGGARSGKSSYAERLAIASNLPVTYIATAMVFDDEFGQRVAHHQARRLHHWKTIEQAHNLAQALQTHATAGECVIVDCLTLWLANTLRQP